VEPCIDEAPGREKKNAYALSLENVISPQNIGEDKRTGETRVSNRERASSAKNSVVNTSEEGIPIELLQGGKAEAGQEKTHTTSLPDRLLMQESGRRDSTGKAVCLTKNIGSLTKLRQKTRGLDMGLGIREGRGLTLTEICFWSQSV